MYSPLFLEAPQPLSKVAHQIVAEGLTRLLAKAHVTVDRARVDLAAADLDVTVGVNK